MQTTKPYELVIRILASFTPFIQKLQYQPICRLCFIKVRVSFFPSLTGALKPQTELKYLQRVKE